MRRDSGGSTPPPEQGDKTSSDDPQRAPTNVGGGPLVLSAAQALEEQRADPDRDTRWEGTMQLLPRRRRVWSDYFTASGNKAVREPEPSPEAAKVQRRKARKAEKRARMAKPGVRKSGMAGLLDALRGTNTDQQAA